jgi:hypothetical protein
MKAVGQETTVIIWQAEKMFTSVNIFTSPEPVFHPWQIQNDSARLMMGGCRLITA